MRKIITLAKNYNDDKGVIMVNINRYYPEADYPNGKLYKEYMGVLSQLLNEAGGKILWRLPIKGTVIGKEEKYHEMFAAFYPSHSAFLQYIILFLFLNTPSFLRFNFRWWWWWWW